MYYRVRYYKRALLRNEGHKDSIRHMVIENELLVSCAKDALGIWDLQVKVINYLR
jgi:hypothetical protein